MYETRAMDFDLRFTCAATQALADRLDPAEAAGLHLVWAAPSDGWAAYFRPYFCALCTRFFGMEMGGGGKPAVMGEGGVELAVGASAVPKPAVRVPATGGVPPANVTTGAAAAAAVPTTPQQEVAHPWPASSCDRRPMTKGGLAHSTPVTTAAQLEVEE